VKLNRIGHATSPISGSTPSPLNLQRTRVICAVARIGPPAATAQAANERMSVATTKNFLHASIDLVRTNVVERVAPRRNCVPAKIRSWPRKSGVVVGWWGWVGFRELVFCARPAGQSSSLVLFVIAP